MLREQQRKTGKWEVNNFTSFKKYIKKHIAVEGTSAQYYRISWENVGYSLN